MQKESIEEALNICIDGIHNSNINIVDKMELLMNIKHFLENYDEMIKVKIKKKEVIYEKKCN